MSLLVASIADKMSWNDLKKREEMLETHAFDEFVSELIGPRRSLPDFRDDWCRSEYPRVATLPKTAVIMCFHNEAWSTLMRSLHSVMDQSPADALVEVLLIDDASNMTHLASKLASIIAQTPKVGGPLCTHTHNILSLSIPRPGSFVWTNVRA